jgi:hypothetical protein
VYKLIHTIVAGSVTAAEFNNVTFSMAVVQNINPMLHFVVYFIRHRDIRAAIVSFVLCRSSIPSAALQGATTKIVKSTIKTGVDGQDVIEDV